MGYLTLRRQSAAAYGYLERLLKFYHPDIKPLPDLLGLCTQVDNVMTEIEDLRRQVKYARRWFERIRDWQELPETSPTNRLVNDAQKPLKTIAKMGLEDLGVKQTTEGTEGTE